MPQAVGLADGEQIVVHLARAHASSAPLEGFVEADAGFCGAEAGQTGWKVADEGSGPAGDAEFEAWAHQGETFDGGEAGVVQGSEIG